MLKIGWNQIWKVGRKQISKVGWKHKTWQTVWMHFTSAPPLLHSLFFFTFSPMIVIGNDGFVRNMRKGWEMRNRGDYERVLLSLSNIWFGNLQYMHFSLFQFLLHFESLLVRMRRVQVCPYSNFVNHQEIHFSEVGLKRCQWENWEQQKIIIWS